MLVLVQNEASNYPWIKVIDRNYYMSIGEIIFA